MVNAHFSLRENQNVWVLGLHIVLETLYSLNLRNVHPLSVVSSHLLLARSQTTDIPRSDTRRAISAWRERDLDWKDFVRRLPIRSKASLLSRVRRSGFFCLLCLFPVAACHPETKYNF